MNNDSILDMGDIKVVQGNYVRLHNLTEQEVNKLWYDTYTKYENIETKSDNHSTIISIIPVLYVLVIRRKDDGLTDIVSNEARRAEFDTISVRPSSFRRITYVKHWKLLTKQLS